MSVSFGDNVRIRATAETEAAGVAGLQGQVYGETTPSVTGVEVIGEPADDFAINVHIEERGKAFWFAADLVEFLDHAAGTEIRLDGVDKRWIRTDDGGWVEESLDESESRQTSARPQAMGPFESAEAAVEYVRRTTFSEPSFTLDIASGFTFAGHADTIGAGMAIVLEAILSNGFWPDGFEQKDGYRTYRYKRDE